MTARCPYIYTAGGLRFHEGDLVVPAATILDEVELRVATGGSVPSRLRRLLDSGRLEQMAAEGQDLIIRSTRVKDAAIAPKELAVLYSGRNPAELPMASIVTPSGEVLVGMDPGRMLGRQGREAYTSGDGPRMLDPYGSWAGMLLQENPAGLAAVATMQIQTAPKSVRNADDSTQRISDAAELLGEIGGRHLREALRSRPAAVAHLSSGAVRRLIDADPEAMLQIARDVAEDSFWYEHNTGPDGIRMRDVDAGGPAPDPAPLLVAHLIASGAYQSADQSSELSGLLARTMRMVDTTADVPPSGSRPRAPEAPIMALALLAAHPEGSPARAALRTAQADMSGQYGFHRAGHLRDQAADIETFSRICSASPGAAERIQEALSDLPLPCLLHNPSSACRRRPYSTCGAEPLSLTYCRLGRGCATLLVVAAD